MTSERIPTRGYSSDKEGLLARLARIEGQIRGVSRMVQEDRYCIDVLTQLAAVGAALNQVSLGLVDGHVRVCVTAECSREEDRAAKVDELMEAVGRLVRR